MTTELRKDALDPQGIINSGKVLQGSLLPFSTKGPLPYLVCSQYTAIYISAQAAGAARLLAP